MNHFLHSTVHVQTLALALPASYSSVIIEKADTLCIIHQSVQAK